jgi:hypothetical protein
MPYTIGKFGHGYRLVMLSNPNYYFSKKPMTKKQVLAQMRAIEMQKHLSGSGIFDYIKNVFYANKAPQLEAAVKKYSNYNITQMKIYRVPILSIFKKLLSIVSFGKFDEYKKRYDDIFHLYCVLELVNPTTGNVVFLETEKQPNILFKERKSLEDTTHGESLLLTLKQPTNFGETIKKLKEIAGSDLTKYSNPFNNCQVYILNIVKSIYSINNNLIEKPIIDFILQDVEDVLTGTTRNVSNFVSSLGHLAGRLLGRGNDEYYC